MENITMVEVDEDHEIGIVIVKSIFLCIFITLGIIGNGTVMLSIKKYPKLKTIPNFFVFNLAVADLLFSLTGMPMILVTTICKKWVLGDFLCNLNGLLNSLFCTTSIWTLVMISVNRYFSVAKAHDIKKIYTVRKTYFMIAGIWIFSFCISMPPLMGWSEFIAGSNFCTVNGKSGLSYGVFLIFMDYIFPLLLLTALYLRIFFLLRRNKAAMMKARSITISSGQNNPVDESPSVTVDYNTDSDSVTIADGKSTENKCPKIDRRFFALLKRKDKNNPVKTMVVKESISADDSFPNEVITPLRKDKKVNADYSMTVTMSNSKIGKNSSTSSSKIVRISSDKEDGSEKRRSLRRLKNLNSVRRFFNELDVTKMLVIVVLAFFLCWTTFMASSVLYAFDLVAEKYQLLTFGIYIACLNSIINPLIYALMNRNFRYYFNALYKGAKNECCC